MHTDSVTHYRTIAATSRGHESVNRNVGDEYVRGEVTNNMAEGYFSQLKRFIDGTQHHHSAMNTYRATCHTSTSCTSLASRPTWSGCARSWVRRQGADSCTGNGRRSGLLVL